MEYVKPVNEPIPDDLFEENMDDYLGIGADADSATIALIVEQEKMGDSISVDDKMMKQYNAKAEAIFRKQFSKAADAIISSVYNNESMNGEQTVFAAKVKQMTEQLGKKQEELASLTNLSSDRTQAIASEIIENITKKKMEAMDKDYIGLKPRLEEKNTNQTNNSGSSSTSIIPSTFTPTTTTPSTTTTTTSSSSTSSKSTSSKSKSNKSYNWDDDPFDPYDNPYMKK